MWVINEIRSDFDYIASMYNVTRWNRDQNWKNWSTNTSQKWFGRTAIGGHPTPTGTAPTSWHGSTTKGYCSHLASSNVLMPNMPLVPSKTRLLSTTDGVKAAPANTAATIAALTDITQAHCSVTNGRTPWPWTKNLGDIGAMLFSANTWLPMSWSLLWHKLWGLSQTN